MSIAYSLITINQSIKYEEEYSIILLPLTQALNYPIIKWLIELAKRLDNSPKHLDESSSAGKRTNTISILGKINQLPEVLAPNLRIILHR